ncbi:tRNA (adenosine(37)-N6)-dimethylallyltransferase MiaA [Polynucleobacter paneuropaeus]|jgi:tRNA dimethylallyltransferase|nr:tRNA (adenosine(37)-N6)-dimethylallyltransferase MiaA [Polynucleobacter paneuropaeus]MBT8558828.1 tRNA (adenosine(37)-N6)-dimethylallyltransferase MiaA [Polynucleobacter paneuropaeus]MBT8566076.1 tRNA (adenosine(37)-N6)-dimethylallyltransferase MiaA [Polynucleobacter paneuropaeus]MBT8568959.1 tRNA (adenosine(37)-N6)-dimethylallyltransferase MiaA [Polynucleobacter paneuropaeus]MBT8582917.1 tRNA (adenosine(37)-N6)-dimethylallyltransferase MiaA [Polynucleobacter paneuropaeus]
MQTELHIQPEHALVLCIVGPTGSGKTHLAMRLAEQAKSQGKGIEIISMDSALVYRGLDIGSAKPTLTERTAVTHHLIDILDPTESYSAARFANDAKKLCFAIRERGNIPIIVGGTMLYWRAWAFGLSSLPPANPEIRARLDEEGKQFGWPAMHQKLALVDPITAQRLEPNDSQRVQRALEVYEATGKSMSAWLADAPSEDGREGSSIPSWITLVSLEPGDRAKLHALLEKRFDHMLEQGFMQEVEGLRKNSALHADLPAIRSVGYRQAWEHLDGKITWDEMRYKSLAATRQLGKRQLTWLRAIAGRKVFDSFNPKELEAALAYCQETLKI